MTETTLPDGTVVDWDIDESIEEAHGFTRLAHVECVHDGQAGNYFEGDVGYIIGFSKHGAGAFHAEPRTAVYVAWEGNDEAMEVQPDDIERI